jgi:competence protein ComEC
MVDGWSWEALGKRPILFPCCFFLGGVALGPTLGLPAVIGLAGAGLLTLAWRLGPRVGALLLLLGGAFLVGAGLAGAGLEVDGPLAGVHRLEGEVEAPRRGPDGVNWVLQVARVDDEPARLRVSLSGAGPDLVAGQRVLVEARLKPLVAAANEGEWSRTAVNERRGLVASGWYELPHLVQLSPPSTWRRWLEARHQALSTDVRVIVSDPDAASLVLTLAAGERAALGDELEDVFSRSGLAHVLSVSGLHVAVIAFSLFALLRWALTRRQYLLVRVLDARALAAPLAVWLVWGYVVYTGSQAPAVRSGVMCTLVLLAHLFQRRSDALNALCVALLVMTLVDAATPLDLSVQLSFTAVLAMVLLAPAVRRAMPIAPPAPQRQTGWVLRLARWREAVLQTAAASIAVTLTTAPIVLGAFQRVSLAGVVSNIVTMPLAGLLTMLSAGGAAAHLVSAWLATPALWCGGLVARGFLLIARAFSELPGGVIALPAPGPVVMLAWWAGLAALVFLRGRWRLLALTAPSALVVLITQALTPATRVDVTFLAVGHGDAIVITSGGHAALVDGGGVPNGHDTGRRFVLPYLRQRLVKRLDLVALSHAHPDHALGLQAVLEEVPTQQVWLPAGVGQGPLVSALLEAAGSAPVDEVEAGDPGLSIGAARLEILGPPVDRGQLESENDRSLVLRVRHDDVTFLLTGDLERQGEAALDPGHVTVMKAPHHGSNTSSTQALLAKSMPKYVVFCVGVKNRFGFPKPEVVERYRRIGSRCFRTDVDGAVTFHSDGHDVTVETISPPPLRAGRRALLRAE